MTADTTLTEERLARYKSGKVKAAIYLFNGVRLIGRVVDYDASAIILDSEQAGLDDGVLVVRQNVATIQRAVAEDRKAPPRK